MKNPASPPVLSSLCVFCGSQIGNNSDFSKAAQSLGEALAEREITLVFGGGRVGLMGTLADAVLENGGKAIGVIPKFLEDKELAHAAVTEMIVVPDMHTRKRTMFDTADAFCVLPGGVGTLDEMFEIVTWRQLHRHNKPIIVLNTAGYWSTLIQLFDQVITSGFAHKGHDSLITVVDHPKDVLSSASAELANPKPPVQFDV